MTEIEVPTESLQEEIHHKASHGEGPSWTGQVALTTAFLAVFAAVAALLAGHHANEAMIEEIQAANQWSYYQAKSIKAAVAQSKIDLLDALGKEVAERDRSKIEEYKHEQEEIQKEAKEKNANASHHLQCHNVLARAVTMFQIGVAIAAIAVLTKRRGLWFLSMGCGLLGLTFLIQSIFY